MKKKTYLFGSISQDTLRERDLIPPFINTLHFLAKANKIHNGTLAYCRAVKRRMEKATYWYEEQVALDLEELIDRLQDFAPPHFIFGAHEADGADFGFWLPAEFPDEDFDGIMGYNIDDLPKGYRGEILKLNDDGSMILYSQDSRGKLHKIWDYPNCMY